MTMIKNILKSVPLALCGMLIYKTVGLTLGLKTLFIITNVLIACTPLPILVIGIAACTL